MLIITNNFRHTVAPDCLLFFSAFCFDVGNGNEKKNFIIVVRTVIAKGVEKSDRLKFF